jgi:hypothetical protein
MEAAMINLKLRGTLKRLHEQGREMAEQEQYERECEREEREWQKHLEEQSMKTKTFELTFKITVAGDAYDSLIKEYGEDGIKDAAKKHLSEMGVEGVGDIELTEIKIS